MLAPTNANFIFGGAIYDIPNTKRYWHNLKNASPLVVDLVVEVPSWMDRWYFVDKKAAAKDQTIECFLHFVSNH